MAFKPLMMALCAVTFSSLTSVNGKYRISWITNYETNAGTNHWVGFELFTADGTKTKWMWPNEYFHMGRYGSNVNKEPSIGDIAKVNLHIQKKWGQHHNDDWDAYQVVISDSETKKTYQTTSRPGWITTGKYKKFTVREIECKDIYNPKNCMKSGSHCGTSSNPQSAFNMAKNDFYGCLKSCNFCYPPDSDEPDDKEARKDEEPTDEEPSGEEPSDEEPTNEEPAPAKHEKKSSSHKKKN